LPYIDASLTTCIAFQEKLQIKEKKEKDEAIFKYAQVDGRTEQVCSTSQQPLHALLQMLAFSLPSV